MVIGGAAAGGDRRLLLLTKAATTSARGKAILPLKNSQRSFICVSNYSKKNDSDAENIWSQRFKVKFRETDGLDGKDDVERPRRKRVKRRWLSDKPPATENEEDSSGILEEFIDSLWILEVFKSYGWALPPIILSLLIATGPKAFVMTLALPLSQSVIAFVFNKFLGRKQSKPKYKSRKKRRRRRRMPFTGGGTPADVDDMPESVMGNGGFGSWVGTEEGSVKTESQEASSFGGWDELDSLESVKSRRRSRTVRRSTKTASSTDGKFGKRERESDLPLLLRLLIAVFPFLASWTKML